MSSSKEFKLVISMYRSLLGLADTLPHFTLIRTFIRCLLMRVFAVLTKKNLLLQLLLGIISWGGQQFKSLDETIKFRIRPRLLYQNS